MLISADTAGGPYLLFKPSGRRAPDRRTDADVEEDESPERSIRCRACGSEVTASRYSTERAGGHRHAFFNPHGLLFEIGLFSQAPGCLVAGRPTDEFTWFPGYLWRHALCAGCGAHLGWRFDSGDDGFFGLVLNRLVEEL